MPNLEPASDGRVKAIEADCLAITVEHPERFPQEMVMLAYDCLSLIARIRSEARHGVEKYGES